MSNESWRIGPENGALTILTGVGGRAAKMGHRLTIDLTSWSAQADWVDGAPVSASLTAEVDSLQVRKGEGGVTPLSGPEKGVVRSNALKVFDAKKYPSIEFSSQDVTAIDGGYRAAGTLRIHGAERPVTVEVSVADDVGQWRLESRTSLRQSDFGLKPFSLMMGTLKVADEVTVECSATLAKNG